MALAYQTAVCPSNLKVYIDSRVSTCGLKKIMAMACLVLVVRTVSCFQWPSYVSGLYTEYAVVLGGKTHHNYVRTRHVKGFALEFKQNGALSLLRAL